MPLPPPTANCNNDLQYPDDCPNGLIMQLIFFPLTLRQRILTLRVLTDRIIHSDATKIASSAPSRSHFGICHTLLLDIKIQSY